MKRGVLTTGPPGKSFLVVYVYLIQISQLYEVAVTIYLGGNKLRELLCATIFWSVYKIFPKIRLNCYGNNTLNNTLAMNVVMGLYLNIYI